MAGKNTRPPLESVTGTELEEVAVGEIEVGFAVGGSDGEVFHGVVAVAGEEGEFVRDLVAEGGSDKGSPEEVLVVGIASVVGAVDGFVIAEFDITDRGR